MRYILSLIVENKHGVLAKVAQVVTGRGYNISTLTVGPSERADTSRMIITFDSDEKIIEQIIKQMNKLVDVIKIFLIDDNEKVERELLLVRISRKKDNEESIERIVKIFRGKIVDVTMKSFVIEITGASRKIDSFVENIKSYGIQDLMRTGPLALPRFDMRTNTKEQIK
ncbi:MAG: acetolactate synthase small subunit [Spirochaetes bacterium GWF1_31_7]|nr:MAG: acetolactate synthase small subunit [Spirochaetes bacterium GWE1_32_154]OHD51295.1 MAG: acetolactate synthase small subunit [Spirochaetes bacterium GWE2_31_10]OHD51492.1 MAG: acetolactate synthase small subunit [Spirochaetes bacterium GWF1_31_7]OHD78809.1 MAG: acetolactate synthase small subunit [Spirochaetes bacterium RIFOXYB1_FULL_32_8]HBD93657.1 acetolactate synthase small subunit [Spirochaetia bacterium]